MQVSRSARPLFRLSIIVLLLLGGACRAPEPVPDNQYQRPVESTAGEPATSSKPVRQLHNQALAAINESQYDIAASYLQRAIKIEPRNGWSWYYLADVHWRQGEYERCRSMLDRADAYVAGDTQLAADSAELRQQCQ